MATPYFYIIKHKPTQKYYAGCKINSSADSSNLMTESGYKTTSKVIKELIEKDSLSAFEIIKIKHFKSLEETLHYETKFLQKINAAENPRFFNKHNGGKNFVNKGSYRLTESTKNKMKKPKSEETIRKMKEALKKRSKESWKKMVETRRKKGLPWVSDEQRQQRKEFNKRYWNEKTKEEQRLRMVEFYKKNSISEETRKKLKEVNSGENNGMFGKKHSEETRQKLKLAWAKRKEKLKIS
jgi:alpha-D-ribose 1-methylphosphonate 5-triphosphate diphosphatase PhnM